MRARRMWVQADVGLRHVPGAAHAAIVVQAVAPAGWGCSRQAVQGSRRRGALCISV